MEVGRVAKRGVADRIARWLIWLPGSLHSAAANFAAAPVGMTEIGLARRGWLGRRVSEWGTGLELMQEWKLGRSSKGSVCKGI